MINYIEPLRIVKVGNVETTLEYFMFNSTPKNFDYKQNTIELAESYWKKFCNKQIKPNILFGIPTTLEMQKLMDLAIRSKATTKPHFAFPLDTIIFELTTTEQTDFYTRLSKIQPISYQQIKQPMVKTQKAIEYTAPSFIR